MPPVVPVGRWCFAFVRDRDGAWLLQGYLQQTTSETRILGSHEHTMSVYLMGSRDRVIARPMDVGGVRSSIYRLGRDGFPSWKPSRLRRVFETWVEFLNLAGAAY